MSEITIAGNLGQEPELRYAQSRKANVRLSVAVTTGRDDTKQTHWFEVKCWDTLAERMSELSKGTRVIVKGRMKEDNWETKDGEKRSKLCLYADEGGPSYRWEERGAARSNVTEDTAVQTVQRGFETDQEPF